MISFFRSIKIFLQLLNNSFSYEGFSKKTSLKISNKLKRIHKLDTTIIPLILIYHDIGNFIRKRDYPQQSYILISGNNLLAPYNLSNNDRLLIEKVIQYHILFATIYTGESTYYGTYSILNDSSLSKLVSDQIYLDLFIEFFLDFFYHGQKQTTENFILDFFFNKKKTAPNTLFLPQQNKKKKRCHPKNHRWSLHQEKKKKKKI